MKPQCTSAWGCAPSSASKHQAELLSVHNIHIQGPCHFTGSCRDPKVGLAPSHWSPVASSAGS